MPDRPTPPKPADPGRKPPSIWPTHSIADYKPDPAAIAAALNLTPNEGRRRDVPERDA